VLRGAFFRAGFLLRFMDWVALLVLGDVDEHDYGTRRFSLRNSQIFLK